MNEHAAHAQAQSGAANLPELQDALVDQGTLECLFRDIAMCTHVLEVIPKFARDVMTGDEKLSIEDALRLLVQGQARAVQVRYRHESAEWWDTIMETPQGFRVVRIRHDFDGMK